MTRKCRTCEGTENLYYIYPAVELGLTWRDGVLLCNKCRGKTLDEVKEMISDAPVRTRRNRRRKVPVG